VASKENFAIPSRANRIGQDSANHLKLNLDKTELLLPGKDCPQMNLLVTIEDIEVSPSPTARNLGVVQDDQLCRNANITSVPRSLQDPAAPLLFNLPKFSHVTPLYRDLRWFPLALLDILLFLSTNVLIVRRLGSKFKMSFHCRYPYWFYNDLKK